jgi:hypothetical protein
MVIKRTVVLQEDPETKDMMLPLDDEIMQELGWDIDDIVEWVDNKDGTYTIRRIDNA